MKSSVYSAKWMRVDKVYSQGFSIVLLVQLKILFNKMKILISIVPLYVWNSKSILYGLSERESLGFRQF